MLITKLKKLILKKIMRRKGIKVGTNTRILTSYRNFGSEPYLVSIGKNCTITSGVKFITHDASIGVALNYKTIPRVNNGYKKELMGRINVGDNVMIGVNTIVLPGVVIENNVIVGANSVVTKSLSSNSVYAGNPTRFICSIEEYYNKKKDNIIDIKTERNPTKRRYYIEKELKNRENSL